MEVLVLGAVGADVESVVQTLQRAGHGVHQCAPLGFEARPGADCVGSATPAACPLQGPVDVALMVNSGPHVDGLQPTGLGCAIRDHLPMAVVGTADDPVLAALEALQARDTAWGNALRELMGREDVECTSTRHDTMLRVDVSADVDPTDTETVGRLTSRAYDVVRKQIPTGIRSIGVGVSGGPML